MTYTEFTDDTCASDTATLTCGIEECCQWDSYDFIKIFHTGTDQAVVKHYSKYPCDPADIIAADKSIYTISEACTAKPDDSGKGYKLEQVSAPQPFKWMNVKIYDDDTCANAPI